MATTRQYWTQYASHPSDLDELVNERLSEGWKLYGGPYSIAPADPEKDPLVCQAMTMRGGAKSITEQLEEDLAR